jgi:hypothetical protein
VNNSGSLSIADSGASLSLQKSKRRRRSAKKLTNGSRGVSIQTQ